MHYHNQARTRSTQLATNSHAVIGVDRTIHLGFNFSPYIPGPRPSLLKIQVARGAESSAGLVVLTSSKQRVASEIGQGVFFRHVALCKLPWKATQRSTISTNLLDTRPFINLDHDSFAKKKKLGPWLHCLVSQWTEPMDLYFVIGVTTNDSLSGSPES
jgi:hypothetical protein